ncbi:DUF341 family protein [Cavenderia fasciculata]|uniref:DUF341 family protein n=1 Tax=Cavenderia fasciculata TaxID=261658 RepID=F4PHH1_CACFS|nr:DUF341 family protein [Cavenderia fasciculata]EGG25155.1 DUF341 family protein [Cavenderia fasciculata]|eukprot:XP_004363006.1 DUF341 family protein [Cavenderia fasciculata]
MESHHHSGISHHNSNGSSTSTTIDSLSPSLSISNSSTPPLYNSGDKKRLRILCLHGYKQNANLFKSKTAVLRKSLDDIAEFVYVDAPHTIDEAKGTASWWRASGDGKEYRGWETTLDYLKNIFIKKGPFDGIIGFSQGAILSSLISSISSLNQESDNYFTGYKEISIKFSLLFSGFQSRATVHQSLYPSNDNESNQGSYPLSKIATPSLHVWGKADELVSASNCESLSLQFSEPHIYIHEQGHLIPLSKKDIEHYRNFLQQFLNNEEGLE